MQLIEREIEFENIDPFFVENAEKPVLGRSAVTPSGEYFSDTGGRS